MHLTMYLLTASMMYFNLADMGTMGDDSAMVANESDPSVHLTNVSWKQINMPLMNAVILPRCSKACVFLIKSAGG